MKKTLLLAPLVGALILAPLVAAGPAQATARHQPVVGWVSCDSGAPVLTYKPTKHVLSCADANSGLRRLTWSAWDQQSAMGAGTYYWNDCKPSCAAGTMHKSKATVELNRPKTQSGEKVFTKVTVTYTDANGQQQVDRSTTIPWTG